MTIGKWISSPAALVVLACFFLPWVTVSCEGTEIGEYSGYELMTGDLVDNTGIPLFDSVDEASADYLLAAIPLAAILTLVAVGLSFSQVSESNAGFTAIGAAVLGILVLAFRWYSNMGDEMLETQIEMGVWGTVAGLSGILIGGIVSVVQARSEPSVDTFMPMDSGMPTTMGLPSPAPVPISAEFPPPPIMPPVDMPSEVTPPTVNAPSPTINMNMAAPVNPVSAPSVNRQSPKTEVLFQVPKALAWLIISEGSRAGHRFRLHEVTSIGRDADNDIVLDDTALSGKHARVRLEDGTFYLYDLASTNGTEMFSEAKGKYEPIYREPLNDKAKVKFGRTILRFMEISDNPKADSANAEQPVANVGD